MDLWISKWDILCSSDDWFITALGVCFRILTLLNCWNFQPNHHFKTFVVGGARYVSQGIVGNLSEMQQMRLSNGLLARVSAYYHDQGKLATLFI